MSISRTTYERLKAFCETNDLPMSRFIESRIGDYLGRTSREDDETARKTAEKYFTF